MAIDQAQRYCHGCERKTLHLRHRTSEMWHVLLTIITLGLWIPVWLFLGLWGMIATGYHCQLCGRRNL